MSWRHPNVVLNLSRLSSCDSMFAHALLPVQPCKQRASYQKWQKFRILEKDLISVINESPVVRKPISLSQD